MTLLDKPCLITAVDLEFNSATRLLESPEIDIINGYRICRGRFGGRSIAIFQSGIGAVGFPDFLAIRLTIESFSSIIVTGLAGALSLSLKRSSAIVYDQCLNADNEPPIETSNKKSPGCDEKASIPCDHTLSQSLYESLLMNGISCKRGSGLTVNRIVTSAVEKLELGERFNARAVDMETYDILRVAKSHNLPAAAVRIISDEADQNLPDFNRAVDARGRMRPGSLFRQMISSPISSGRFLIGIRSVSHAMQKTIDAILKASIG